MKRAAVLATVLVSLAAGSAAMAGQGVHLGADHREPPRASNNDHRHWRYGDRRDDRRYYRAPPPRVVYRPAPRHYGMYYPPRGYYAHRWNRGERLPVAYYQPRYVIGNYRDCGLRAPPRGYHWVRVNDDAVLAAITTGVVLDVAFHLFG
jgi:Ni/Co efflux regulator RcnB